MAGGFADVMAIPANAAALNGLLADDGAQQGCFANAVAPQHAGYLAGARGQGYPAQGLRGAIEKIDVVHLQHHLTPQIDFDNARVVLHRLQRPLGEYRTFVQDRDLGAQGADEFHVVFDHDHAPGPGNLA